MRPIASAKREPIGSRGSPGAGGGGWSRRSGASQGVATILRFDGPPGQARGRGDERSMTLAVTVVCQDGVVVAADSRTTLGNHRMPRAAATSPTRCSPRARWRWPPTARRSSTSAASPATWPSSPWSRRATATTPGHRPQARRLLRRSLRRPRAGRRRRGRRPPPPDVATLGFLVSGYDDAGVGEAWRSRCRAAPSSRSPRPPTAAARAGGASPTWSPAWSRGADLELLGPPGRP